MVLGLMYNLNSSADEGIKNPDILEAIQKFKYENSKRNQELLLEKINLGKYLLITINSDLKGNKNQDGTTTVGKGAKTSVILFSDKEGNMFLPIFTDWIELYKYENIHKNDWGTSKVTGLVLPAKEVWDLALNVANYHGVAINPAGDPVQLERAHLKSLLKQ